MESLLNANPLIVNFMTPQQPKTISSNELKVIYDPKSQITIVCGGGSSSTRCYDGYVRTKEKTYSGYWERNDASRWTDD